MQSGNKKIRVKFDATKLNELSKDETQAVRTLLEKGAEQYARRVELKQEITKIYDANRTNIEQFERILDDDKKRADKKKNNEYFAELNKLINKTTRLSEMKDALAKIANLMDRLSIVEDKTIVEDLSNDLIKLLNKFRLLIWSYNCNVLTENNPKSFEKEKCNLDEVYNATINKFNDNKVPQYFVSLNAKQSYEIPLGKTETETTSYEIIPVQAMSYRKRGQGKEGFVYEVEDKVVGEGAYSVVKSLAGKIVLSFEGLLFKIYGKDNHKEYVVKQLKSIVQTRKEAENLKYVKHAASKPPTESAHGGDIVQRRLQGIEVYSALYEKNILPKENKEMFIIDLGYKLIEAYQVQIESSNIIHRDIKCENILVELTPKNSDTVEIGKVNIIDVNLSHKKNLNNLETANIVGSYISMSPEALYKEQCETPSDIYSLGVVLIEIIAVVLGKRDAIKKIMDQFYDQIIYSLNKKPFNKDDVRICINNYHIRLMAILKESLNESSLSDNAKVILNKLLSSMCNENFTNRPTTDEIIKTFNELRFDVISQTDRDKARLLREANQTAINLKNKLAYFEISTSDSLELYKTPIYTKAIKYEENHQSNSEQKPNTGKFESKIGNDIIETLNQIPDGSSEDYIREVVFTLKIEAFNGLTTKQAIINKAREIVKVFEEQANDSLLLRSIIIELPEKVAEFKHQYNKDLNLNKEYLSHLLDRVDEVFAKDRKHGVTIDSMLELSKKFTEANNAIRKEVDKEINHLNEQVKNYKLLEAKELLLNAVKDYENSTNSFCNKICKRRFFSAVRQKEISDFLYIIKEKQTLEELIDLTKQAKNNISRGLFGRSKLKTIMEQAIAEVDSLLNNHIETQIKKQKID